MEIKPIRSEADYQAALKEIERRMESQPGTPEGDRMDVLVTLVKTYEVKHFPFPEPEDPVQVLEYYMESRGFSRADLIAYLGSKERVSEFFNRKRGLSLEMIRRLHNGLGIPAELMIGKHAHNSAGVHSPRTKSYVQVHSSVRPKGRKFRPAVPPWNRDDFNFQALSINGERFFDGLGDRIGYYFQLPWQPAGTSFFFIGQPEGFWFGCPPFCFEPLCGYDQ